MGDDEHLFNVRQMASRVYVCYSVCVCASGPRCVKAATCVLAVFMLGGTELASILSLIWIGCKCLGSHNSNNHLTCLSPNSAQGKSRQKLTPN